MHEFVFYTSEGQCNAPDNSDVENYQILGFIKGRDVNDALNRLIEENTWILDKGYRVEDIRQKELRI